MFATIPQKEVSHVELSSAQSAILLDGKLANVV